MEQAISVQISQIRQRHGRMMERLLKEAGITDCNSAQGQILQALWQGDDVPITLLSERTGLAKTSLTGMLDRMEAGELICRVHDPQDRRQVRIRLTQRAQLLQMQYHQVAEMGEQRLCRGMRPEEVEMLHALLERVLENTKEDE